MATTLCLIVFVITQLVDPVWVYFVEDGLVPEGTTILSHCS